MTRPDFTDSVRTMLRAGQRLGITISAVLLGLTLATAQAAVPGAAGSEMRNDYVVFQMNNAQTAAAALRDLNDLLDAQPTVRIVVVAHDDGVKALLRASKETPNADNERAVKALMARDVRFEICARSLERLGLRPASMIEGVTLVPLGIAELAQLEGRGYVYLR
jgi:intracellular sulfur oxidation DsrE/DsrF family protein